jgi:beta-lactamase class D
MHKVFSEIDRLRIAEAERAAERYRREMRPRSAVRLSVSWRRRRQTVRLRPATESF